ncbi:MAG: polyprenol phosphomannose-dependent alpha 1,6 mannosyltransferase MptB, partial [Actinobacteria bacterium]|nr:polyprenol phosphomannose-dependent alpha 1,6 mannosyltransferase MptB [Actinomycetota bacterium]
LTHGQLTFLSLLLLLVVTGAFLVVAREARRGRVGVGWVVGAAAVSLGIAVAAPLLLSRDVYSYAIYGRIPALYGANPYVRVPADFPTDAFLPVVSGSWLRTVSLYGPVFTTISAALVRVFRSPEAAVVAFKILSGVGIALTMAFAAAACRIVRPERVALAVAVVGLNPVVVLHTVGGGHNDALVAAGLTAALLLGLRATRGERPLQRWALAATLVLTLAALIKIVAAIPLALWVWSVVRRTEPGRRARVGVEHLAVAGLVAILAFLPYLQGWSTLTPLSTLSSLQGWASGPGLVARGARSLGDAIGGSGSATGDILDVMVSVAFLATFLLVFLRLLRRARPEGSGDDWGIALLAFALSAPYLIPWYAAWILPFVPLMRDPRLAGVALVVAGVLGVTGVPAEPSGSPALWEGMLLAVHYVAAPVMLAALAGTLYLLSGRAPRRASGRG